MRVGERNGGVLWEYYEDRPRSTPVISAHTGTVKSTILPFSQAKSLSLRKVVTSRLEDVKEASAFSLGSK